MSTASDDHPDPGAASSLSRGDLRVVVGAVVLLLALVVADAVTGVVLVSTLGIVVVAVGLLASPRAVVLTGTVALALGVVLVLTVDRGDLSPLRLGNIVIGTLIAYVGSAARVARERRHRAELVRREAEAARLTIAEEEHRRVFDELQAALVPPLPVLPGIETDAVYEPAGASSPSGGDLHEVHLLPDDSLVAIVVDVMGHGVGSTRDALRVVAMARTLLETGVPLEDLPDRVDGYLNAAEEAGAAGSPGPLLDVTRTSRVTTTVTATMVVAQVDPHTGGTTVVCGGHPPPLVVRADGRTAYVDALGPTIGYPRGASSVASRVVLGPGDALVLYTDGLVEHGRDIIAGMDGLAAAAGAALSGAADGMARRLVDAVVPEGEARDDLLVLVLRRPAD